MSVQKNHYVMTGIKYDYDEFYSLLKNKDVNSTTIGTSDEGPYMDNAFNGIFHKDNVCVISDGMNGEYVYVGHVTQKSAPDGDLDDFGVAELPDTGKVCNWIYEAFGFSGPCKLHVFTHYR